MKRWCRLALLFVVAIAATGCGEDEASCAQTECGGSCVDTGSDEANCGACGNVCEPGSACTDGVCCAEGAIACAGVCTDPGARESCGGCGVACGATEVCAADGDGFACADCGGETRCGNTCVDLQGDGANCGACGTACATGEVCSEGACVLDCRGGRTACGTSCVDLQSDSLHCGACDDACEGNQECSAGACGCRADELACGGTCVPVLDNEDHCGACDKACAEDERCSDGVCELRCFGNESPCDGRCVALGTDPENCGACGTTCGLGEVCIDGGCACPEPTSACEGYCADLAADPNNCGGCGTVCGNGQRCLDGGCTEDCRATETDCDGFCANLQDSPLHCGACGVECDAGQGCVKGVCTTMPLPDLSVDAGVLSSSLNYLVTNFEANSCAVVEGCVAGTGDRRLLRFSTRTPNLGTADLAVGPPSGNPHLVFSQCHGHYHFEDYASYRLLDMQGNVAAVGHKQAFCLMDINRVDPDAPATSPQYGCSNQGISMGWADTYGSGLDCQWVDITGVPAGQYQLEIAVNPARVFAELDYTNNVTTIPVEIPHDPNSCVPSAEICHNGIDEDCDGMPDDRCPPIDTNDSCANAFPLVRDGTFTAAVGTATVDDVTSSCGAASGRDVIFQLDLPSEQLVYLSTFGSAVSTSLSVRTGSCTGTESSCTDDACGTQQEQWVGVLPAGTHFVVVEAHGVTADTTVQIKVQTSSCSGASPIESGVQVSGDTTGGTNTRVACSGAAGPEDFWYFTTCPGTHTASATTCGATWDTVVAIGSTCTGSPVACNDDASCGRASELTGVPLVGDGLWFAIVDGFSSFHEGVYDLTVSW
ncbi:MXAN_6577-like cysteine-rich protein [Vulgatibacter sp.]|uniref:MXAN_6577-like cysteine-rich protein n=1 Tax=Vulgatibacter sp. TaxID=1971226 RepID=UPI003562E52D